MNPILHQTSPQKENRVFNILVADDHAIVRVGMTVLIRAVYGEVNIEEAEDGESVIRKLKSGSFDLLILDINMPQTEPLSLTGYLIKEFPSLKILIYSVSQEIFFAKRLLRLGAHGYIIKQSRESEIRYAIQQVLEGHIYISDFIAEAISYEQIRNKKDNPFEQLSDREFEVALQILKGNPVSVIADTLNLNKSTIGSHKAMILRKLHLSNAMELMHLAKEYKII